MLLGLHDYDSESKSLVEDSECEVTSRIIVQVRQLEDVFGETVCESISGGAMFFCMCVLVLISGLYVLAPASAYTQLISVSFHMTHFSRALVPRTSDAAARQPIWHH